MSQAHSIDQATAQQYYQKFEGNYFAYKLSGKPLNDTERIDGILRAIGETIEHRIHATLVHGGGAQVDKILGGTSKHRKTHLRITPKDKIPEIVAACSALQRNIGERCAALSIPFQMLDAGVVHAERIPGHGETGRVIGVNAEAIRGVQEQGKLPIVPFGGRDEHGNYLNVNADTSSAEIAAALRAEKLFLMTDVDGLQVPNAQGKNRTLSYVDYDGLVGLLRQQYSDGHFVIDEGMLPKITAAMRAVAGGVNAVHILHADGDALRREALTRTGIGTLIERIQQHKIVFPAPETAFESLKKIREECQGEDYCTPLGTPFLRSLSDERLRELLPTSLVFYHRDVPIGAVYFTPVLTHPNTALIGGFVVAENHQNSQFGTHLFETCLETVHEAGFSQAVSITASPAVKVLYRSYGVLDEDGVFAELLQRSRERFKPEEQEEVALFRFELNETVRNGREAKMDEQS